LTLAPPSRFNPRMRSFSILIAAFLALMNSGFAGLEVTKARYGNDAAYADVRGIIDAYVRNNTLSFPVNARSMGGDPSGRAPDYFFVVYKVNGREFTDTVADGGIFTFRGIAGVVPVQPKINLPFLKPAGPVSAPLAIVNRSGRVISAYNVDRFGRWGWAADLVSGRTLSLTGRVGEEWILTDERGNALARQRLSRGENVIIAEPTGGGRGGSASSADEAWVRFENVSYRPVYLYNLDPARRWNWLATLEPGGGYSASTRVGETWIVTDPGNRVLRNMTVPPGQSRVKIN